MVNLTLSFQNPEPPGTPPFVLSDQNGDSIINMDDLTAADGTAHFQAIASDKAGHAIYQDQVKAKGHDIIMVGNIHYTGGSEPISAIVDDAVADGKTVTAAFEWSKEATADVQAAINAISPADLKADPSIRAGLAGQLILAYAAMTGLSRAELRTLAQRLQAPDNQALAGLKSDIMAILDSREAGATIVFFEPGGDYDLQREEQIANTLLEYKPKSDNELLLVSTGVRHVLKTRQSPWEKQLVEEANIPAHESAAQLMAQRAAASGLSIASVIMQPDVGTVTLNESIGFSNNEQKQESLTPLSVGADAADADLYIYYRPPTMTPDSEVYQPTPVRPVVYGH